MRRRWKTWIGVDSEDVGSFLVVLQAEILERYVDALRSIDYKGKPIIACVAEKEFALADMIKMEKGGFPVFSTPKQDPDDLTMMDLHHKRVKEQGAKGSERQQKEERILSA